MNKKIKNIQKNIKLNYAREVTEKLLNDEKLRTLLDDINSHFFKYRWTLSYDAYLGISELHHIQFNCFLEMTGYKLVYCRNSGNIGFRPR